MSWETLINYFQNNIEPKFNASLTTDEHGETFLKLQPEEYSRTRQVQRSFTEVRENVLNTLFLDEKVRRQRDITSSRQVTKSQSYFKGVFAEASHCTETDDESENIFEF